ncbi:glycosyltransferase family 2 protein, partial [Pedococcus aerophilus]|uniref:glycosyltransferase family 2 protein n=1 Tax=Pedococcus aerophilus TaxID=436356 RepID=UPI0031E09A46
MIDLTVIIPIRNRDARRVELAASTLAAACGDLTFEIIVSDGGSSDLDEVAAASHRIGSILVSTPSNHWNKPVVMNRALSVARGEWILCADVDMVWAPGSIASAVSRLRGSSSDSVLAFQTRDLPPGPSNALLDDFGQIPWGELQQVSQMHSRWGNGVLLFPRALAAKVGGYDQRLSVYGVEDLDFCLRLQSVGAIFMWSAPRHERVYHVWHPTLQNRDKRLGWAKRALERNRSILRTDHSVVRNVTEARPVDQPLVTVAISTQNRADMLRTA